MLRLAVGTTRSPAKTATAAKIRSHFVFRNLAVTVLVERLQGRRRMIDLIGGDLAIMIRVKRVESEVEPARTSGSPPTGATTAARTTAFTATGLLAIRFRELGDFVAGQYPIVIGIAPFEHALHAFGNFALFELTVVVGVEHHERRRE